MLRSFWLFEGLRPSSLQPNLVTFGGCLTALQQMAQWERSLRTSDTFSRDVPAYGAQVAACAMSRRWVEVLWLLKDLKKHKLEKDAWMQQWTVYALGSDKGQACGGVEMLSAYQAEQMLRATQRTPDARYVNMREQIDKKAVQKRAEKLHFLEAEKPNKHMIFVDEENHAPRQPCPGGCSDWGRFLAAFAVLALKASMA
eukprot:g22848.t1